MMTKLINDEADQQETGSVNGLKGLNEDIE